jgi:hypothetical protein
LLICCHGKSNLGIGLRQINATGKSLLIFRNRVKPRNQKIFPFASDPNQFTDSRRPVPTRGALRTSRNAVRDAVDAAVSGAQIAGRTNDAEAYGQVVSFWPPDAGVKSARRRAGDGGKKARFTGESTK